MTKNTVTTLFWAASNDMSLFEPTLPKSTAFFPTNVPPVEIIFGLTRLLAVLATGCPSPRTSGQVVTS